MLEEVREKRLAIAKDVIEQLDAHAYNVRMNVYATIDGINFLTDDASKRLGARFQTTDLQTIVRSNPECTVCAVGSLLLSAARLYNEMSVEDVATPDSTSGIADALSPYFDLRQLVLIELAFEGRNYGLLLNERLFRIDYTDQWRSVEEPEILITHETVRAAKEYLENRLLDPDHDGALRKIMENIIEHNGEFVP